MVPQHINLAAPDLLVQDLVVLAQESDDYYS
jgi:hypothetical protein